MFYRLLNEIKSYDRFDTWNYAWHLKITEGWLMV